MEPEHHRTPALPGLCQGVSNGFKVVLSWVFCLEVGVLGGNVWRLRKREKIKERKRKRENEGEKEQ